ncbi:MAG: chemotaxis protein CheD [Endomicrobiales bacterium]|nr:chemotaxis protein CheD [Endomicrobiales bacterium]
MTETKSQRISINIAEFAIAKHSEIIETQSLGSCVGVALYDRTTKMGGLAHIMLPDSKKVMVGGKPGKYADVAIKLMVDKLQEAGVNKMNLTAKIAGGACMFSGAGISDFMNIGLRNVNAIKQILSEMKIPLVAEDCGANHGRTVEFNLDSGKMTVKSSMASTKEI